jgi:hypothetical protein
MLDLSFSIGTGGVDSITGKRKLLLVVGQKEESLCPAQPVMQMHGSQERRTTYIMVRKPSFDTDSRDCIYDSRGICRSISKGVSLARFRKIRHPPMRFDRGYVCFGRGRCWQSRGELKLVTEIWVGNYPVLQEKSATRQKARYGHTYIKRLQNASTCLPLGRFPSCHPNQSCRLAADRYNTKIAHKSNNSLSIDHKRFICEP